MTNFSLSLSKALVADYLHKSHNFQELEQRNPACHRAYIASLNSLPEVAVPWSEDDMLSINSFHVFNGAALMLHNNVHRWWKMNGVTPERGGWPTEMPIFSMFHSYMDRLLELWLDRNPGNRYGVGGACDSDCIPKPISSFYYATYGEAARANYSTYREAAHNAKRPQLYAPGGLSEPNASDCMDRMLIFQQRLNYSESCRSTNDFGYSYSPWPMTAPKAQAVKMETAVTAALGVCRSPHRLPLARNHHTPHSSPPPTCQLIMLIIVRGARRCPCREEPNSDRCHTAGTPLRYRFLPATFDTEDCLA